MPPIFLSIIPIILSIIMAIMAISPLGGAVAAPMLMAPAPGADPTMGAAGIAPPPMLPIILSIMPIILSII